MPYYLIYTCRIHIEEVLRYMKPIVIIGADAAGMSAASVIKREIKDQQVIVFGKEPHISYSA